MICFRYLLLW